MEQDFTLGSPNGGNIINKTTQTKSNQDPGEIEGKLNTARVEFDIPSMVRFIDDRGIDVLWERAYFCPCLNPESGHPRMDCPRCHGKGIAYLPAKETKMIIQSQEKGINNIDIGILESGTAIGTTKLEHRISYRDRFTVPEVLMPQSMVYYVNESRIKKGIPLYYDVKEVTFITTQEDIVREEEYEIKNNRLFLDSKYKNQTVTINILMTLRYVVSDILKESRYQYTKFNQPKPRFDNLPQKLLLKREDVIVLQDPYKVNDGDISDVELQVEDPKASVSKPINASGGFFGGALGN